MTSGRKNIVRRNLTSIDLRADSKPELVRIPFLPIVDAEGDGWIYCYYFPYVRASQKSAGKRRWTCKIGRTKQDVRGCVASQFKQSGTFEGPEIGFYAMVVDVATFERAMHQKLEPHQLGEDGSGAEWFETNIGEVRRAYREVRWPGLAALPLRLIMLLRMRFSGRT